MPQSPSPSSLASCPFCGGTPSVVTRNVEPQGDPWYGRKDETFVLCDCGACLFDGGFHEGFWDAETRAPVAWNRRAALSAVEALGQQEPVAWEHRSWRDGCGGEPVGWGPWERLLPKRPQTMDDAVREMRSYIADGYRYELRALYASPAALQQQEAGRVHAYPTPLDLLLDALGALTDGDDRFDSAIHEGPERDELQAVYDRVKADRIATLACAPSPTEPADGVSSSDAERIAPTSPDGGKPDSEQAKGDGRGL